MLPILLILVLIGGMLIPLQAGINMNLAAKVQSAPWAAMISFAVGTAALLLYVTLRRIGWPTWDQAAAWPVWIWAGGLCGAYLVGISIFAAPKIGAAVLMALLVAGQLGASLAFDHFGWMGFEVRTVNLGRVAGVLLVLIGAVLLKRF